jgi:gluconolactonase
MNRSLDRRRLLGATAGLAVGAVAGRLSAEDSERSYPVVGGVRRLDPALDALIDADAPVEKILDGIIWSEGPCWVGGADGYLLFSDVRGNAIHRWSERDGLSRWVSPSGYDGGQHPAFREPGTNGLILARGGLVAADCGNRAVVRFDLETKAKTFLATHYQGRRFNSPNDLVLAEDGSIYFTDPPYGLEGVHDSPLREMDYTGVFRLAPDNSVTLIDDGVMPNGIGLSPDGRRLFATDRAGWVSWALDDQGRPGPREIHIDRQQSGVQGGDGFKFDRQGYLWASSRDGVSIFEGARCIGIITSDDVISNCEIGADGHLYMSSNHAIVRIGVRAEKLLRSRI